MSRTEVNDTLYTEYAEKVKRYVSGKVIHRQDAEDIVSEVFLKVYRSFDTFDGEKSSVSTWIYTIARNTVTDYYRRQRPTEELPDTYPVDTRIDDDLLQKEALSELVNALKAFDERLRYIIISKYYRAQSLKTIAEHLGISYAYAKVLHSTALSELRKHLYRYYD